MSGVSLVLGLASRTSGLVARCGEGLLKLGLRPSFFLMSCVGLVLGLASRTSGLVGCYGHGLLKLRKSFKKALDEKVLDEKGWTKRVLHEKGLPRMDACDS